MNLVPQLAPFARLCSLCLGSAKAAKLPLGEVGYEQNCSNQRVLATFSPKGENSLLAMLAATAALALLAFHQLERRRWRVAEAAAPEAVVEHGAQAPLQVLT